MINYIKDFFNIPRTFTIDVYGIGYMGNTFKYKTIKVITKRTKANNQRKLNALALAEMNSIKVTFPRLAAKLNNKDK